MRRVAVVSLLSAITAAASAGPVTLNHTGRALDGTGQPITGSRTLTVTLWDAQTGGTAVHSETTTAALEAGFYALTLGASGDLDAADIGTTGLWVEVEVDSVSLGRSPIGFVPLAAVADSVVGGIANVTELQINGQTVIDSTGAVTRTCPVGFVDIGAKCTRQPDTTSRSYGAAVAYCYDQGARLCDEQDHTRLCMMGGTVGLAYPDLTWFWTGTRSWEQYANGNVYATHHVVRSRGAVGGGNCWDNYTGVMASTNGVSWDYGDKLYRAWCCWSK